MKFVLFFILIIALLYIIYSNSRHEAISINQPLESEIALKKAVLHEGDIIAYKTLSHASLNYEISEEFLLYAIIMANKYDYPQAYFDVFTELTKVFWDDLTKMDEKSAEIAIEYLIPAAVKGHHQANDMVDNYNIKIDDNGKEQIIRIYKSRLVRQGFLN